MARNKWKNEWSNENEWMSKHIYIYIHIYRYTHTHIYTYRYTMILMLYKNKLNRTKNKSIFRFCDGNLISTIYILGDCKLAKMPFSSKKCLDTKLNYLSEYSSNVKTQQIHQPVDVSFDAQNIFAMKK